MWQLLFVDDDDEECKRVKEYLEGESIVAPDDHVHVEPLTDFTVALEEMEKHRFDLLILDVRLGAHDEGPEEEAGVRTLEQIKQRRFVPVIFYTALPHLVQDLETHLIRVVEKGSDPTRLAETVKSVFATQLPMVNRALIRHFETVQRDYMWGFVAGHWEQFINTPDRTGLAYLLARRLAMSLSGPGIQQLANDLGDSSGVSTVEGQVHPMLYYVMPPVNPSPLTGDLYQGRIGDQNGYWVMLTPSCDLVQKKAEWVLMAQCTLLTDQEEYRKWSGQLPNPSNTSNTSLQELMKNNRKGRDIQPERFYFLPSALDLPGLVVDFQQLATVPREQMGHLDRLASLDSPFAEALLARFARYFGRLGTPDIDLEVVLRRLRVMADES